MRLRLQVLIGLMIGLINWSKLVYIDLNFPILTQKV